MKKFKTFIVTVAHTRIAPCDYTVESTSKTRAIHYILAVCHLRSRTDVKVAAKEVQK